MVDELRQARDAWQRQTGRGTRQTAIRWKQGLLRLGVVSSVLWIGLRRARWRIDFVGVGDSAGDDLRRR